MKFCKLVAFFVWITSPLKANQIEEWMKAEVAKPNKIVEIKAEDKGFTAKVEAKTAPVVKGHESFYQISVEIGSDTPLECFLYKTDIDPANGLSTILNATLEKASEKEATQVDAGLVHNNPFIYTESTYFLENEGKKLFGFLKGQVTLVGGKSLVCLHNEPGYRETFKRVLSSLVENLKIQNLEEPELIFRDVQISKFGETRVGFTDIRYAKEKDGHVSYSASTSLMIPAKTIFISTDNYSVEIADKNNHLLAGSYISQANQKLAYQLTLKKDKKNTYTLEGTVGDKNISQPLAPQKEGEPILSSYAQIKGLKEQYVTKGEKGNLQFHLYTPQIEPLKLTQIDYSYGGKKKGSVLLKMSMNGIDSLVLLDRQGMPKKVQSQVKGMTVLSWRVLASGSL